MIDRETNTATLSIHAGVGVRSVTWSYDDRYIGASVGGDVVVWSAESGELVGTFGKATAVDFSPIEYEIAFIDKEQEVLVTRNISNELE
ncbi:MAG: hypothetical protein AAFU54_11420 [Chloroflexota bacterium]